MEQTKGFWMVTDPNDMEGEVWRNIAGYETRYQVSNFGRIRKRENVCIFNYSTLRHSVGQIIRQSKSTNGYLKVRLSGSDGSSTTVNVHKLVATAFIPCNDSCLVVNHLNEIKTDNRVENLEWCTIQENNNYGTGPERRAKSLRNNPYRSKIVSAYSKDDGRWITDYPSQREAARQLKCALSKIQRCINKPNRTFKGMYFISDK